MCEAVVRTPSHGLARGCPSQPRPARSRASLGRRPPSIGSGQQDTGQAGCLSPLGLGCLGVAVGGPGCWEGRSLGIPADAPGRFQGPPLICPTGGSPMPVNTGPGSASFLVTGLGGGGGGSTFVFPPSHLLRWTGDRFSP